MWWNCIAKTPGSSVAVCWTLVAWCVLNQRTLPLLNQPGTLVWLTLPDDASKSALVGQDLFANQGLRWIYKISRVWETWSWHSCRFLFCPVWACRQKHWHFSPLLACSTEMTLHLCCRRRAFLFSPAALVTQHTHQAALCKSSACWGERTVPRTPPRQPHGPQTTQDLLLESIVLECVLPMKHLFKSCDSPRVNLWLN